MQCHSFSFLEEKGIDVLELPEFMVEVVQESGGVIVVVWFSFGLVGGGNVGEVWGGFGVEVGVGTGDSNDAVSVSTSTSTLSAFLSENTSP